MLPNADGCGTGLQLSAKDVVLGRPDMIQSLWLSSRLWLVKRQDWSIRRTFSSKKGWQQTNKTIFTGRWAETDPLTPRSLFSSSLSPNNLPSIFHHQPNTTSFIPGFLSADTSPTKIVMNPASPCAPSPNKTNCDFFLSAISSPYRWRMARWRFKVARYGVDQTKKRCFLVSSVHMQFLFISRCGGSVIRLPWRLPRYTLAYKPSNGKNRPAALL